MDLNQRRASGTLSGAQLGADSPTSLSEVCEQYGIPGFLCSCDMAASALSIAGEDPCTYGPFQSACPDLHQEYINKGRCEGIPDNQPPPGSGYPPQQAGMSTATKLVLGVGAASVLFYAVSNS